mgnify:FL=1
MKYSDQIKPISYLKANTAAILRRMAERGEPLVITQNGVAKAVIQDVVSYEQTQETMALLKILALGNRQIEQGKVGPAAAAIKRLRESKARGRCVSKCCSPRTQTAISKIFTATLPNPTLPERPMTYSTASKR